MLIAEEEYSSDDDDDEEEETTPATSLVAVAATPTPPSSLFESPNEKPPNKIQHCFMAKSSEISSSSTSNSNSRTMHMDNNDSSSSNAEIIAFNEHVSKLKGDDKKYFGIVMTELADAHDIIDKNVKLREKVRMS